MKTATDLFGDDDKAAIADAIARAETRTAAEIVPVVATASGRYDRAEDIFGLLCSLVLLAIYWLFFQTSVDAEWSSASHAQPLLWPVLLIIVAGFVLGAFLATVIPSLRLPFISRKEMLEEVERRALETFQRQRIRATEASNGVLIYLSLYEHMVHVVGDDAVNAHINPGEWQQVADIIVEGMKARQPKEGMVKAISHCGDMLSSHFPWQEGDRNELSNQLVLID